MLESKRLNIGQEFYPQIQESRTPKSKSILVEFKDKKADLEFINPKRDYYVKALTYSEEDFLIFKSLVTDPEVMKTTSLFNRKPAPDNDRVLRELFVKFIETNIVDNEPLCYKVVSNITFEVMGIAAVLVTSRDADNKLMELEIAHYYHTKYQGSYIPVSVGSLLIKRCFAISSVHKLLATFLPDNLKSQATGIRNGFEFLCKIQKEDMPYFVYCIERKNYTHNKVKLSDLGCSISNYVRNIQKTASLSQDGFYNTICTTASSY